VADVTAVSYLEEGTVKNNMKGYERNHRGHREKLILCVLQTMNYVILQGLKENLRELDIFIKTNLFPA